MNRHNEASAILAAPPEAVFARLDDQRRLAQHMDRPSIIMGGGRMTYEFDTAKGQAVGSHIRMGGKAFGMKLAVEEIVTEREPPRRKVWKTIGIPDLVVIGTYEMGFELGPSAGGSHLRVWIDYDPPAGGMGRWMPWLGAYYARWCVSQMVRDATLHFQ
jgi:hypothetical protein